MSSYPGGGYEGRPQFRFGGPLTPVVKGFMIACAAVFAVQFFWRGWGGGGDFDRLFGLYTPWFWRGAFFQLLTFHFLHGSIWHLAFNMLTMWMFAGELEQLWGAKKFVIYLFVVGLGAGACQLLSAPFLDVPVIGASGIVYGILLAFGMTYPNRVVLLYFLIPLKVKWLVIGMGVIEFSMAFDPSGPMKIAHFAHLGGMLFGFLFLRWDGLFLRLRGAYYRRKLERQRKKRKIYVVRGDGDEPPFVH
jgi:membrane associated rhomboid family serine protease